MMPEIYHSLVNHNNQVYYNHLKPPEVELVCPCYRQFPLLVELHLDIR
jgi:hypothetical protein